ncbi:MAG: AMP-binding protein, partial [Chloroflexi bacterium]|nr:AMP-binding protein [Chloroflexota bacterium]
AAEEIYPTLTSGGTLVLRDEEMLGAFDRLLASCERLGITVLDLPTAYWHQLTAAMAERHLKLPDCIRLMIIGGERALPGAVANWHTAIDPEHRVRLINSYGPTETTIVATWSELTPDQATGAEAPIGRPVGNTHVYVLDAHQQPVPIGVVGELHIGGAGLARGYLNRPELTATQFIADPFSANARLYKTGDLVRWRYDGQLEYIGRRDDQIKIRGFRVELGEIEAALSRHPAIKDVAVIARERGTERDLIAYVVQNKGTKEQENKEQTGTIIPPRLPQWERGVGGEGLRSFLGQHLPDYMIPRVFMQLDALPLLPTGKVDRRALPEPIEHERAGDSAYIAPRSEIEAQLAAIWSAVLGVERVGVHDNFFALGGHSILAAQLLWRIRHECQAEIALRSLFVTPTIAELAEEIAQTKQAAAQPEIPPIATVERDGPLPLSFAQQRLWFLDRLAPERALYNVPMAFELHGPLDHAALQQAIHGLVARHEALRTRLSETDGQATQTVLPQQPTSMETIDLGEEELGAHIQTEALRPFELTAEPLFRVQLLRLHRVPSGHGTRDRHVLLVVAHHIAADGWSMQLIFRDLGTLYAAAHRGQSTSLPHVSVQPVDFAVWQRGLQVQTILDRQLRYWQATLRDAPESLDLPTDRPRPEERDYAGASYQLTLPHATLGRLKALSEQHNSTLFMTLLAGFQALLHRVTGQRDIVVGAPIANRRYAELAETVGFFVNTLALRTEFPRDLTAATLLAAVRETTVSAFEHQDVPFEQIVDALGVTRALNRHPVFQVMFTLEEANSFSFALDGLDVREIAPETQISKFDLALTAAETEAGLALNFEYTSDIFERATIERLAQSFTVLLAGLINQPHAP